MPGAVSRRAALGLAGLGTAAGVAATAGVGALTGRPAAGSPARAAALPADVTVAGWRAARGDRYFVAHRGAGDTMPEHSLAAYQAALAWGAQCLELSVRMTSDGVLICLHDDDYQRTTTVAGTVADLPSTVLRGLRLHAPQLGPAWSDPMPLIPLLDEVLDAIGGRAVLAIEAKDSRAYPAVRQAVARFGLADSVMIKTDHRSGLIPTARADGFPVFGYIGSAAELTPDALDALVAKLDAGRGDVLVLPASAGPGADPLVKRAAGSGLPVWVAPVHRRSDVARYAALGVSGFITPGLGYLTRDSAIARQDTWAFGAIAPGELTRDPLGTAWAPGWADGGELTLAAAEQRHFLTLGQLSPVATPDRYSVNVQARWTSPPGPAYAPGSADAPGAAVALVAGHADDAYHQPGGGRGTGYLATLAVDGTLAISLHRNGSAEEKPLGSTKTAAPAAGQFVQLRWQVDGQRITWTRTDTGESVTAQDGTARGGYLHLGRIGSGTAGFRRLVVS